MPIDTDESLDTPTLDGLTASEIRALANGTAPGEIVKRIRARVGSGHLMDAMLTYQTFRDKHMIEQLSVHGVRIGWSVTDEALEWATR